MTKVVAQCVLLHKSHQSNRSELLVRVMSMTLLQIRKQSRTAREQKKINYQNVCEKRYALVCGFTQELLDNHSTCRLQWGLIPKTQPDVCQNRAISGRTRLPSVLFPRRIRQDGRCFTDRESCQIPIYTHLNFIWININGQWYHRTVKNISLSYIRKSCNRTSNKSMFIASGLASAIAVRG